MNARRSGRRNRNGYRERRWDTRLGTMMLNVPKVREGGYAPSFIEHRKRSEQALISVIQEAVVQGVSGAARRGNTGVSGCRESHRRPYISDLYSAAGGGFCPTIRRSHRRQVSVFNVFARSHLRPVARCMHTAASNTLRLSQAFDPSPNSASRQH